MGWGHASRDPRWLPHRSVASPCRPLLPVLADLFVLQGMPGRSFSPPAAPGAPRTALGCRVLPCPGHMGGVWVPTGVQHRCAGRCVCIHCPLLRSAGSSAGLSRARLLGSVSHRPRAPAASSGVDFALSTPLISHRVLFSGLSPLIPGSQLLSPCHSQPSLPYIS